MEKLEFYLNFKNDNTGLIEISEVVKFDASNFVIEQDNKRYGRDVIYGNDETNLEFYAGIYESGLTHEFENLIRYYNDYGFESEVEFIVKNNGLDFTIGVLDFQTAETDQIEYFKCRVIQETKQALVKRREDVKVDVFSDKDLDDNPITPLQTYNILLKAKPIYQLSEWEHSRLGQYVATYTYTENLPSGFSDVSTILATNSINTVLKQGIENTLSNLDVDNALSPATLFTTDAFVYLEAKNDLTNLKIDINDLKLNAVSSISNTPSSNVITASGKVQLIVRYGYINQSVSQYTTIVLHEKDFGLENSAIYYFPENYTLNIDLLPSGMRLYIYVLPTCTATFDNYTTSGQFFTNYRVFGDMSGGKITITATSTSVDSVVKGVRHVDYIKQCYKSATGMNVVAPRLDVGSEHYDNFVFNGKLIRQVTNEAFYGTLKDNNEQLRELNSDYQVNKDNVYIGYYNDIYPNIEAGSFTTFPDESFKSSVNDRYAIQTVEYKYKSFEQDKDSDNTIDAVHTSTQWLSSNKLVEGNLSIEVPFVRDPFEIEFARRNNIIIKDTTSLENDDKVYIVDCVESTANSRNKFVKFLKIQENNTELRILSDGTFSWNLLGFNVGDIVKINGVNRIVLNITNNIITTDYSGGSLTYDAVIEFDYPLSNVQYINRTNEGFTQINNIFSGDNFSNLRYTIKRNMMYFSPYFKTILKYNNGKLKNTYFKSNGKAETEYLSGGLVIENADYLKSQMSEAILTPIIYTTKLDATFEDVYNLLLNMQTINSNDSIGGFIRIMDNNERVIKVYPKKLNYVWSTGELTIDGEEKQESEFVTISKNNNIFYINEVGYDETIIGKLETRTKGEYIQLLDNRNVALINYTKFDKISVNSNFFSTFEETIEAILTL